MKNLFSIFALLIFQFSFAQYQITIDAYVLDKQSGEPIPYVNLSVVNKTISAVSDTEGKVVLSYDEEAVVDNDIIRFSNVAYKDLEVKFGQLYRLLTNSNKIYLTKKEFLNGNSLGEDNITGVVTDPNGVVQGASVKVKNTLIETQTNSEGEFRISANDGDVLVFNFLGMLPKEIAVPKSEKVNVELVPNGELLGEVEIQGKAKKKLVETGVGKKDADALGYSVNTISSKDISPGAITIADVIRGRFAGVKVSGFGDNAQFIMRGMGSIEAPAPAIFEVDGTIYTDPPTFVNVQQIETISILKSLSAVNRYGAMARGGVIQIKMKNSGKLLDKDGKPVNTALVKGNDYEENLDDLDAVTSKSSISNRLEKANSYEEALAIYKSANQNLSYESVPFIVDASDGFMKWDKVFSVKILKQGVQKAFSNVKALKTIAYKLDEKGAYEESKLVYQRIAILRPKDIQSYKDLALSYTAAGDYSEALSLYKKMLANKMPDVDFFPVGEAIVNEVKHLVAHHRLDVDYRDLHPDLLSAKFKKDLRIVFDWNDPNVEFELQFVNPKKKFYNWIHTNFENRDRIIDEVKNGYHTEEYIIDDADSGEWIINLEGLSNNDRNNPTYLKYTVYKNYGLPEETKEIKVIKLYTQEQKVTLDRFRYK